jgi:hypothetical protein
MRTATHKHLSVVDGLARFARVTVVESSDGSSLPEPVLLLNDHQIDRRSEADERFIGAAIQAVRDTEAKLGWRGLPLRVDKLESSYVDMHPEAARLAAISAATELIGGHRDA